MMTNINYGVPMQIHTLDAVIKFKIRLYLQRYLDHQVFRSNYNFNTFNFPHKVVSHRTCVTFGRS